MNNVASAMNNYAFMLEKGDYVDQNMEEATRLFKLSSDNGSIVASFNYGIQLYFGRGIEKNKKEAFKYFEKSAKEGHVDAITPAIIFHYYI